MGRKRKEYVATNIKTNEQIRGYALDFEKMCNLSKRDFEKYVEYGLVCRETWLFELIDNEQRMTIEPLNSDTEIKREPITHRQNINENPDRITFELWKEWDRTTSIFKLSIRREKTKEKRRENFRKRTLRTPYNT